MARTKIVATLGPSTKDPRTIRSLIELGVDVFRVNFSHGDSAQYTELIKNVRGSSGEKPVAILGDLAGPKLRCGKIANEPVFLKEGCPFILTTRTIMGSDKAASVNYTNLPSEIHPKERIFLDDGSIELRVDKIQREDIHCTVITQGALRSNKGINLPNTTLTIPALTAKDRDMISFGIKMGLDFFALSFVKHADDIRKTRRILRRLGSDIPLVAKIEKHEAIGNLEEIIEAADGAMVARGDLGIEVPLEQVPIIQKRIIRLCNEKGKPVITATQMMESMILNPRPTRAEVTDIANAILDGTDAVMLSGETAVGKYPCQAVKLMDTIARAIEETLDYNEKLARRSLAEAGSIPDAISLATSHIARSLDAAAILCLSATGYTARFVARYRPQCPILVFTPDPKIQRRLNISWGVIPFSLEKIPKRRGLGGFDAIVNRAMEIAKREKFIHKGDRIVVTAGLPLGVEKTTNMLRVVEV